MKKTIITSILLILALILGTTGVFAENRNNNPLLREILIDGNQMEVPFDQFVADYVLATEKEKISIEAITDDPNAKAQIIGNTNLSMGNNDIEIKVTAEDGTTTKSYFLHITRGNVQTANANLQNIQIEGYTLNPSFNQTDLEYLVEYTGNIEKLNITATPQSSNAKVEILNNNNFSSTYHIVTIKVTAENGITTKEYRIRAKQVKEGEHEHEEEEELEGNSKEEDSKKDDKNENSQNTATSENTIDKKTSAQVDNNGNIWIFVIIFVVAIAGITAFVIINRKKGKH